MTSKHCFTNYMREDFRHRIWMLALSILGNLMALPVVYMMTVSNRYSGAESYRISLRAHSISYFLKCQSMIPAGIIALVGAVIVGIGGYRYLFHKDMVDTYESIPVKKSTRFWATWLNGFLIWLVPYVICMVLVTVFSVSSYLGCKAEYLKLIDIDKTEVIWLTSGQLIGYALGNMLTMIISFLTVYHLVILCMAFCGNVLNLLLVGGVAGCGVASIHLLFNIYCSYYLETWMGTYEKGFAQIVYGSPAISAIYNLYKYVYLIQENETYSIVKLVGGNLLLTIVLLVLAYLAFLKRPSELAEQGTNNILVRTAVQIIITVVSVMGGWIMFSTLSEAVTEDNFAVGWGAFGGILCGVFVFGVTNIIFRMDFKAFLKRKLLMTLAVLGGLLICLDFAYDWSGFDTYVPKENEIVSAAISIPAYTIGQYSYYSNYEVFLDKMKLTDTEAVRELMTAGVSKAENSSYMCEAFVRVTLKNGKTVSRRYSLDETDMDALKKIVTSPEYIDACYRIEPDYMTDVTTITLERDNISEDIRKKEAKEAGKLILEAYSKDLEENPELVVLGSRTLCVIRFSNYNYGSVYSSCDICVYEGMTNTLQVLCNLGYEEYATDVPAEQVEKMVMHVYPWNLQSADAKDPAEAVAMLYGVQPDNSGICSGEVVHDERNNYWVVTLTDKKDIEDMLKLASYINYSSCSAAVVEGSDCYYLDRSGDKNYVTLMKDAMPVRIVNAVYEAVKDWEGFLDNDGVDIDSEF